SFECKHGRIGGGDPVILAFGRYGGQALTEQSDLDLVFLFSGSHEAMSDGDSPLPATSYFNRFFQRVTSALTVPTAAGPLYEVDTRLRPSGAQGLLAVSIDSFATYQKSAAWAWEHMALTRARIVTGTDHSDEVRAAIAGGLRQERDRSKLKNDIAAMRADMEKAHPFSGSMDVKRGRGGLIDLEFLIHHQQLKKLTGFHPDLREALTQLIDHSLLPEALLKAHDVLASYLIMSRLVEGAVEGPGNAATRALVARSCDAKDWTTLKREIASARKTVATAWTHDFGRKWT
ncbi:MAG: glutamine-synthetase adenylyltransferase, partial [Pacificimonas sp.]